MIQDDDFTANAVGDKAVRVIADLARDRMIQREKTKRILIGAVFVLVIIASLVAVFAPEGRQGLGYAVSAVLIILALGAIGVSKFLLRVPGIELDTLRVQPHRNTNKDDDSNNIASA